MTIENIGGVEIGDGDGDATMEENFEDGDTNDVLNHQRKSTIALMKINLC